MMKIAIYFFSVLFSVLIYSDVSVLQDRALSDTWQDNLLTKYANYDSNDPFFSKCNLLSGDIGTFDESCIEPKTDIFIWGDSHAAALSPGIRDLFPTKKISQLTTSGCRIGFPSDDTKTFREKMCSESNRIALNSIERTNASIVIIAQEKEHDLIDLKVLMPLLESFEVQKIYIIGPVPQWRPSLPLAVIQFDYKSTRIVSRYFDLNIFKGNEKTKKLIDEYTYDGHVNVKYVDLIRFFCDSKNIENISCMVWSESNKKDLIIFDYGHLTREGSSLISKVFFEGLFDG